MVVNYMLSNRDWEIWNSDNIPLLEQNWNLCKEHYYQVIGKILPKFSSVLDIGCGIGIFYPLLSANASYMGIDITPDMIKRALEVYPNGNFQQGDLFDLHYNQKFDLVWVVNILPNIPYQHYNLAFDQIRKVASKYIMFSVLLGNQNFIIDGSWKEVYSVIMLNYLKAILQDIQIISQVPMLDKQSHNGNEFQRMLFLCETIQN